MVNPMVNLRLLLTLIGVCLAVNLVAAQRIVDSELFAGKNAVVCTQDKRETEGGLTIGVGTKLLYLSVGSLMFLGFVVSCS